MSVHKCSPSPTVPKAIRNPVVIQKQVRHQWCPYPISSKTTWLIRFLTMGDHNPQIDEPKKRGKSTINLDQGFSMAQQKSHEKPMIGSASPSMNSHWRPSNWLVLFASEHPQSAINPTQSHMFLVNHHFFLVESPFSNGFPSEHLHLLREPGVLEIASPPCDPFAAGPRWPSWGLADVAPGLNHRTLGRIGTCCCFKNTPNAGDWTYWKECIYIYILITIYAI